MLKFVVAVTCTLWFAAGVATAGEKKLMHCFAFTALDTATEADWQAFFKATDTLQRQTPGMTRVWYGKLQRPLGQLQVTNPADGKKLGAAKPGEEVTVPVRRIQRQYGVCMEMEDEATLQKYADSPAHKDWMTAYEKVRVPGTTSFNILGQ